MATAGQQGQQADIQQTLNDVMTGYRSLKQYHKPSRMLEHKQKEIYGLLWHKQQHLRRYLPRGMGAETTARQTREF
eukprot:5056572-Amphidinium_carterae.1